MAYSDRLREARKKAGLTQTELGGLVGCAKTTITGYETGKSEPNMATLSRIMQVLNVDANFIFQDEAFEHFNSHATSSEMEFLVKPYRALDQNGQKMVRTVLELELARCSSSVEDNANQENSIESE